MFRKSDQPSDAGSSETNPPEPRVAKRSRLLTFVAIACFAVAGVLYLNSWLNPPPPISVPSADASIEPFVAAYLASQIELARKDRRNGELRAQLGLAYGANGLWEAARGSFENAAILDPEEPLAPLYAAVATEFGGDRETAIGMYEELSQRLPDFPQVFSRLGEARLRQGELEAAAEAFERLQELLPEEWRGYAGAAEVRLIQGQAEPALPLVDKALSLDPNAAPAHHLRGLILEALGKEAEAGEELIWAPNPIRPPLADEWARQVPEHMRRENDMIGMARNMLQAGQADRVIPILTTALQYNTNSAGIRTFLGLAHQQAGHLDLAADLFEASLQVESNQLITLIALANTRLQLGDSSSAGALAERAVNQAPDTPEPYILSANVALAEDRDEDAVSALEEASALAPENPQLHLDIANILLLNQDRPEEALKHYEQAVAILPAMIPAHIRIAQIQVQRANTNEALAAIRTALQYAPGDTNLLAFEAALLNPDSVNAATQTTTNAPIQSD